MKAALKGALSTGNPRQLWKRYVIAVALIAALLGTTHFAASMALDANARNAELINLSGRQRMLSQRILYLSLQAADHNQQGVRERLETSIALFLDSQAKLSSDPRLSNDLVNHYGDGGQLNKRVQVFADMAKRVAQDPENAQDHLNILLDFDSEGLLADLNTAVTFFEQTAAQDAQQLEFVQNVSFYAAIVILFLEGVVIFIPAQRIVTRSIADLETQSEIISKAKTEAIRRNQELESLKDRVEHEATHDALTGLPNRRSLEGHMAKLKSCADASSGTISVLHVDLDRFKQINDTLGHAAGDHVLRHVAHMLRSCTRQDDLVARVGGDEFVIFPAINATAQELSCLAGRIISKMSQPIPYKDGICHFGASIGIGIGICSADSSTVDPSDLLVKADIALYHAKRLGRGRYEFFTPELASKVEQEKQAADELLAAFENDQFLVHYQPIFCARTSTIASIEALVRWQHPERGILNAGAFIDSIYKLGLAAELDSLVLELIERDLAVAARSGADLPPIAINISASSLKKGTLLKRIQRSALVDHGLSLEISEAVEFETESDNIKALLRDIRALGVSIDIDDFGTSHASIFSFQKVEPDRIKIARELLTDIKTSEKTRRLINGTCQLAKTFGASVVAEGAEDVKTATLLQALGCDFIQGFGLSRPKALPELMLELAPPASQDGAMTA